MKRKGLLFIVIIACISAVCFVVSLMIWINEAKKFQTDYFDSYVNNHLKNIANHVAEKRDYILLENSVNGNTIAKNDSGSQLSFAAFDSIVNYVVEEEFPTQLYIGGVSYAIIDNDWHKIIKQKGKDTSLFDFFSSRYKANLSNIVPGKNYELSIVFFAKINSGNSKMYVSILIISSVFLIIVLTSIIIILVQGMKLIKISQVKTDYITNLTHEFKTPISTISLASEILSGATVCETPAKVRQYAGIIYDENLRLEHHLDQLMQISALESDSFKVNLASCDLHELIRNSADIYNSIVCEKKGRITLELEATDSVYLVDELHFVNALTNVLDNAIKYNDNAPEISVVTANGNNGIKIKVSDNGIGIKDSDKKDIFRKFFRVHTGDVYEVRGYGLGLFYAKFVAEQMKGDLTLVESVPGKGSVFQFYFKNQHIN
jgi:signal transduction histidine kinase